MTCSCFFEQTNWNKLWSLNQMPPHMKLVNRYVCFYVHPFIFICMNILLHVKSSVNPSTCTRNAIKCLLAGWLLNHWNATAKQAWLFFSNVRSIIFWGIEQRDLEKKAVYTIICSWITHSMAFCEMVDDRQSILEHVICVRMLKHRCRVIETGFY